MTPLEGSLCALAATGGVEIFLLMLVWAKRTELRRRLGL